MINKEILKKAVAKAEKNGYLLDNVKPSELVCWWVEGFVIEDYTINDIIFSHAFAKAYWGESGEFKSLEYGLITTSPSMQAWQYHLQQMVLCEEPLKYIEKFLPDENERTFILICHQCKWHEEIGCAVKTPQPCPNCRKPNYHNMVTGTRKEIEEWLETWSEDKNE